ncbi:MAG: hypothetical protein ACKOBL_12240 [Chloroflexota bacterium]
MSEISTDQRQSRSVIFASVAVFVIILVFSVLRVKFYGDPALSIAGNDTITYVEAAQVPLFSAEIMTGRRLLTTNLIYKFFEPENGYEILVNGSVDTTRRVIQPGFDKIVILQLILSLLGWGALAWFVAENLRDPWLKILSAILILLFAYTPQMADWDSILMSESLTFSLFAFQLALLIKIASEIYKNPEAKITHWAISWGVVFFFWTFLRDTNLFTALMSIVMIAILFVSQRFRKSKSLLGIATFLMLTFVLGIYTSSISVRSTVQLINLYKDDIFPHPERVGYFEKFGMPALETSEFKAWVAEKGSSAMAQFMLSHPGYPTLKILRDFEPAFHEIKQTYFTAKYLNPTREVLFALGNAFHPENTTPFLMSLIVLVGIIFLAAKDVDNSRLWAWIGLWLFFSSSLTLIPTILGDTWALNRHALYSTTIFRLTPLVFSVILVDIAIQKKAPQQN